MLFSQTFDICIIGIQPAEVKRDKKLPSKLVRWLRISAAVSLDGHFFLRLLIRAAKSARANARRIGRHC
jgi:hypothetical protein